MSSKDDKSILNVVLAGADYPLVPEALKELRFNRINLFKDCWYLHLNKKENSINNQNLTGWMYRK